MRNIKLTYGGHTFLLVILLALLLGACNKQELLTSPSDNAAEKRSFLTPDPRTGQLNVTQVNLVSDEAEYNALHLDKDLVNAWGLAFSETGEAWVVSNGKGLSKIYDQNGNEVLKPVQIPFNGLLSGSAPTGVVYNTTGRFF